jgi:hypothetical protein
MRKKNSTTIPHHMSIGKVLLFYFKSILKKSSFYLWNPQQEVHTCENHVGVLFIKHDGVGSTLILVRLFRFDIVWINYICKGFNVDYILGTIAHYKLHATVQFIDIFHAATKPQIHDVMVLFGGRKWNRADSKNSFTKTT